MERLDEINGLFKMLETAEYYGDASTINDLSRQIHQRLIDIGEAMLADPTQLVDAANVFISCSEIMQPIDFYESVLLVKKAISILDSAARAARGTGDFKQASDLFRKIGEMHVEMLGDAMIAGKFYREAIDCIKKQVRFAEAATKPAGLYNLHYSLAELHQMVGDWKSVEQHARMAIETSKEAEKYYMVATSYKLLLQATHQSGDKERLLAVFYEARDYFESLLQHETAPEKKTNFMQIAEIYHVFASFHDLLQDVLEDVSEFNKISQKEAECYVDIAKDYERQSDSIGSALHYHSAGLVLQKIGQYTDACAAFERSARYYAVADVLDSAADNYLAAANCMESNSQFLEAIKLIQKACKLYEQAGFIEVSVANQYRALDIHDYITTSESILRQAILKALAGSLEHLAAVRADAGENRDAAHYLVELANLVFMDHDMPSCLRHLKNALDLLEDSTTPETSTDAGTCNDLLAILLIALITDRDAGISKQVALLQAEGERTPVGEEYETLAMHLVQCKNADACWTRAAYKNPIVYNNPLIRNLVAIWAQVHEARLRNQ
jgi:tetratricopeptide (TPR) repeat protein